MELSPGSAFGPYRIDGVLGQGGMASVFRAYEENLDRFVALKVLPAELLHDASFAERFRREARVAAKLEHPHVVPIHAYGIESGRPWMALRLVGSGSLADLLKEGPLEPARAVAILRDVADALDYAHQKGVIHRDVKPHNVLLDERGRAYLADFGIARMLEASSHITATGLIQGTPSYMAPEQVEGKTLGPACDVYALGIVAYQCLTGRVPFSGPTPVSVLMKHVTTPPPLPPPSELAPPLTGALNQCLAKDPSGRWPTAGVFVDALERGARDQTTAILPPPERAPAPVSDTPTRVARPPGLPPPKPRRGRRWGVGVALTAAALLVVGGLAARRAKQSHPSATAPQPPAAVAEATPGTPPPRPVTTPTPLVPTRKAAKPAPPPATPRATPEPVPTPAEPEPTPTPEAVPEPPPAPEPVATSTSEPAAGPAGATTPEPEPTPTAEPAAGPAAATTAEPEATPDARRAVSSGPLSVFFVPQLERRLFKRSREKDVSDSAEDMRKAVAQGGGLELAQSRADATAVILVLERGRKRRLGLPGERQVRLRVTTGGQSIEFVSQDKALGFNTWKGAAKQAVKRAEDWLRATLDAP